MTTFWAVVATALATYFAHDKVAAALARARGKTRVVQHRTATRIIAKADAAVREAASGE